MPGGRSEHGSLLSGNLCPSRVSSQCKSTIIEYVDEKSVHLIVMGSTSKDALKRFMAGATCMNVLKSLHALFHLFTRKWIVVAAGAECTISFVEVQWIAGLTLCVGLTMR